MAEVASLRAAVSDITETAQGKCMLRAFGSEPFAYERFLSACKNRVDQAEARFRATFEFRKRWGLDKGSSVAASRDHVLRVAELKGRLVSPSLAERLTPLWFGNYGTVTVDGSPVHYIRLRCDVRKFSSTCTEDELSRWYIQWMERSLCLLNARNAPGTAGSNWRGMVEVIDLTGLTLNQVHLPSLQLLSRILKIGKEHYPENLRTAVVIAAPGFAAAGWAVRRAPSASPPLPSHRVPTTRALRRRSSARHSPLPQWPRSR